MIQKMKKLVVVVRVASMMKKMRMGLQLNQKMIMVQRVKNQLQMKNRSKCMLKSNCVVASFFLRVSHLPSAISY